MGYFSREEPQMDIDARMCECVCARRAELKTLSEELTDEYEADKQAALSQLSQQRDVEIMAAKESWQRRVEDLLEQVVHSHGSHLERVCHLS